MPESIETVSMTPMFGEWREAYTPIAELGRRLSQLRSAAGEERKFHFTDISGRKWYSSDTLVRAYCDVAVDALRSKRPNIFSSPLHCKMAILFFSAKTDLTLYGGVARKEKRLRHHETVLRILLKGALHYLYPEEDTILVKGILSDGDPFHRELDDSRIIWRITWTITQVGRH